MPASTARRPRPPFTRGQRLAGLALLVMALIQVPLLQFPASYSDGSVRMVPLSALEVLGLGLMSTPGLARMAPAVHGLLLPGTWVRQATRQLEACWYNPTVLQPCNVRLLRDLPALLEQSDPSELLDVYVDQLGRWRGLTQAGGALFALSSLVAWAVDAAGGLAMGLVMVLYCGVKGGCSPVWLTVVWLVAQIVLYVSSASTTTTTVTAGTPDVAAADAQAEDAASDGGRRKKRS